VSISGTDAEADVDNEAGSGSSGCGSVVIALMQKHRRRLRKEGKTDLTIGYAVYKVLSKPRPLLYTRCLENHGHFYVQDCSWKHRFYINPRIRHLLQCQQVAA